MTPLLTSLAGRSLWLRYLGSTFVVVGFALLRAALTRHLQDYSFFLFIPAVLVAALLWGRGPGHWATAISAVLAVGFFTDPRYHFVVGEEDVIPLALFLATCLGISELSHAVRTALLRAKAAEEQLTVLLQELEHRTKNNFQVISSIPAAQAKSHGDGTVREALESAAARVNAVARAQETVRVGAQANAVLLDRYLDELCAGLADLFGTVGRVRILVDADRVEVAGTTAGPLGLVVNELVTNAIKYAFPDDRTGEVRILLRRLPDGWVELAVEDDGVHTGRFRLVTRKDAALGRLLDPPCEKCATPRPCSLVWLRAGGSSRSARAEINAVGRRASISGRIDCPAGGLRLSLYCGLSPLT